MASGYENLDNGGGTPPEQRDRTLMERVQAAEAAGGGRLAAGHGQLGGTLRDDSIRRKKRDLQRKGEIIGAPPITISDRAKEKMRVREAQAQPKRERSGPERRGTAEPTIVDPRLGIISKSELEKRRREEIRMKEAMERGRKKGESQRVSRYGRVYAEAPPQKNRPRP